MASSNAGRRSSTSGLASCARSSTAALPAVERSAWASAVARSRSASVVVSCSSSALIRSCRSCLLAVGRRRRPSACRGASRPRSRPARLGPGAPGHDGWPPGRPPRRPPSSPRCRSAVPPPRGPCAAASRSWTSNERMCSTDSSCCSRICAWSWTICSSRAPIRRRTFSSSTPATPERANPIPSRLPNRPARSNANETIVINSAIAARPAATGCTRPQGWPADCTIGAYDWTSSTAAAGLTLRPIRSGV